MRFLILSLLAGLFLAGNFAWAAPNSVSSASGSSADAAGTEKAPGTGRSGLGSEELDAPLRQAPDKGLAEAELAQYRNRQKEMMDRLHQGGNLTESSAGSFDEQSTSLSLNRARLEASYADGRITREEYDEGKRALDASEEAFFRRGLARRKEQAG